MKKWVLWWCGWSVPDSVPEDHMLERWPETMTGWRTGEGDDYSTWAGAVWARDKAEARATVLRCYGKSAKKISWRFEPEARPDDFTPSDRFGGKLPPKPELRS